MKRLGKSAVMLVTLLVSFGLLVQMGLAASLLEGDWEWKNTDTWSDATDVVTSLEDGALSLVISFDSSKGYGKVAAQRLLDGQDWSEVKGVKMDIYNTTEGAIRLSVVLGTAVDGWQEVPGRMIRPGLAEGMRFTFLDVKSELTDWNLGSPSGLDDMDSFYIYFMPVEEGLKGEVYIDNIELF